MMEEQAIPTFLFVSSSCYQEKGVGSGKTCHFVWPSAKSALSTLCLGCAPDKWERGLDSPFLVYLPKQPLNALLNKNLK